MHEESTVEKTAGVNNVSSPSVVMMNKENIEININEMRDRERRKTNIILFNVAESTTDDTETRKQHDADEVSCMLSTELNIQTVVDKPVRLGPKIQGSKWPRPLIVSVGSEEAKWQILKESKNLAKARKETYRTVYIKKDMTPMEREADTELRNQLLDKRKKADEEGTLEKWIIKKGKVIRQR
jgi:hypothetical protein